MCCMMLCRDRRCQYHLAVYCQQQTPIDTFVMAHVNFPRNATFGRKIELNSKLIENVKRMFLIFFLLLFWSPFYWLLYCIISTNQNFVSKIVVIFGVMRRIIINLSSDIITFHFLRCWCVQMEFSQHKKKKNQTLQLNDGWIALHTRSSNTIRIVFRALNILLT